MRKLTMKQAKEHMEIDKEYEELKNIRRAMGTKGHEMEALSDLMWLLLYLFAGIAVGIAIGG